MADANERHEGSLQKEVELLEAIYIHELTLEGPKERPSSVTLLLHPSTCDEGEKQYVCLTLQIFLPEEYPDALPAIHIRNPRGLSDVHIQSIISNLRELAGKSLGSPMLYELIEYAKESLTDNNRPSCACAICLCHFQDGHSFTKTECYHYFHSNCLARYIEYSLGKLKEKEKAINDDNDKQIVCPMCRLPITYDLVILKAAPEDPSEDDEISYFPDKKMKQQQKEMAELFREQLKKGGIINVEEERNKYLIEIKRAPALENTEGTADDNNCAPQMDADLMRFTSAHFEDDQSKSMNQADKGSRKQGRERHSYSRGNREENDMKYGCKDDMRWDGRNKRHGNHRPRSGCTGREFHNGQRSREYNPLKQHNGKYKGSSKNQTRALREGERVEKNYLKVVYKEIKGEKSIKDVVEDENLEQDSAKSAVINGQVQEVCRNSDATLCPDENVDRSALGTTQRDHNRKRTDGGYKEESRDKTTRSARKKENISRYNKNLTQRENKLEDQKYEIRYKNTRAKSFIPSDKTAENVHGDDNRRRRNKETKKPEQHYRDSSDSALNESGKKSFSKKYFEDSKAVHDDVRGQLTCVENVLQANPKLYNRSTASIHTPPPGLAEIKKNFRGSISPPPGFEKNDSLVGSPPPGF